MACRSETDRDRFNTIIEKWLRATPEEKAELIRQKIRLEDEVEGAETGYDRARENTALIHR